MNTQASDEARVLPAGHPGASIVAQIVAGALEEDRASFDVTTQATIPADQPGEATLIYKEDGVVCGLEVVREVFWQMSDEIEIWVLGRVARMRSRTRRSWSGLA